MEYTTPLLAPPSNDNWTIDDARTEKEYVSERDTLLAAFKEELNVAIGKIITQEEELQIIEIPYQVALQAYQWAHEYLGGNLHEKALKIGQATFDHELAHYAVAWGTYTELYFALELSLRDDGWLLWIPTVEINTESLTPLQLMHIDAAPGADMEEQDRDDAERHASQLAKPPIEQSQ